jgi:hypothetical protein
MGEEKRMAGSYEILHAIHVGDKEVLFGEDANSSDMRYMVCFCERGNPLGIEEFTFAQGSSDFLEMMTEFSDRVRSQLEAVKAEHGKITVPLEPFTRAECTSIGYDQNIENMIAVIDPECLRPEYRTADKQIVLVTGGFGARGNARGRAVYTTNLYSGKNSRWNRKDILGILTPKQQPAWVKEKLTQIAERQKQQEERER